MGSELERRSISDDRCAAVARPRRGPGHSPGQAGLAADAVAIGPEVAHPAVGAAFLAFGRDRVRALASRGLPFEPLTAKDQHDRQGEERDRADKKENLGSLIHEVSLNDWCASPRCRPRRTCEA